MSILGVGVCFKVVERVLIRMVMKSGWSISMRE